MEFKTPKSITTTTTTESTENEEKQTPENTSHPEIEFDNQTKGSLLPSTNYTEPDWSAKPTSSFKLTVIKDGKEINSIDLDGRSITLFGRVESCDVRLEHPTISREHAVLQYKPYEEDKELEEGFYLFDLGSTHGCKINKNKIPQRKYIRVRTGHLIRFGESTRLYILESKDGYQAEVELEAEREIEDFTKQKTEKEQISNFVSWGIETIVDTTNTIQEGEKDEFYKKDPKRYLTEFFEREGLEMQFDSDQLACGKNRIGFTVKIQLPLEDGNGHPLFAEATIEGKKREAIRACALEACRMLDTSGILRESPYVSSRKRKSAIRADNDFYSSDEDSFLDRTGEIECKREKRIHKNRKLSDKTGEVETYSTLHTKLLMIQSEIKELELLIKATESRNKQETEETEDLEEFMKELKSTKNMKSVSKLKYKLSQLRNEEKRISKLETIAKPTEILINTKITETAITKELDGYGLKLAPENRKKDFLQKTTINIDTETQIIENKTNKVEPEKKKVYSVELPQYLKVALSTNNNDTKDQKTDSEIPEGDYIDWLPPTNQSGDGTTKLNDELGY